MELPKVLQEIIDSMVHELGMKKVLDQLILAHSRGNGAYGTYGTTSLECVVQTPFRYIHIARTINIPRELKRLSLIYEAMGGDDHYSPRRHQLRLNTYILHEYVHKPLFGRVIQIPKSRRPRRPRRPKRIVMSRFEKPNKQKKREKVWELPRSRR